VASKAYNAFGAGVSDVHFHQIPLLFIIPLLFK